MPRREPLMSLWDACVYLGNPKPQGKDVRRLRHQIKVVEMRVGKPVFPRTGGKGKGARYQVTHTLIRRHFLGEAGDMPTLPSVLEKRFERIEDRFDELGNLIDLQKRTIKGVCARLARVENVCRIG